MARDTQTQLRNEMIYSVFVRNYSEAGNFAGVTADLQRIKDLGTDILWLLPINPIGESTVRGHLVRHMQSRTTVGSIRNTGL